jgi:hypothetical protein
MDEIYKAVHINMTSPPAARQDVAHRSRRPGLRDVLPLLAIPPPGTVAEAQAIHVFTMEIPYRKYFFIMEPGSIHA